MCNAIPSQFSQLFVQFVDPISLVLNGSAPPHGLGIERPIGELEHSVLLKKLSAKHILKDLDHGDEGVVEAGVGAVECCGSVVKLNHS